MTNEVITDPKHIEAAAHEVRQGWNLADVALRYGLQVRHLVSFLKVRPETVKDLNENVRVMAVMEREKNLATLIKIRDTGKNDMARIKAAQAIDERAGVSFDRHDGGVTVQIFGENAGGLKVSDLRELAMEMAGRFGPEGKKVIDAEFTLNPAREGKDGEPGGTPAGAPQDHQAREGTEAE